MGNLQKTHIIEAASWIVIIAILYAFSFEFDKEIEIYRFGASGWPRSILALFCLVVVGNIWYQYNHGSKIQAGRVGISDDDISRQIALYRHGLQSRLSLQHHCYMRGRSNRLVSIQPRLSLF